MKNYKIAIIGGGPAGMMAAISAGKILKQNKQNENNITNANDSCEVVLIEKNENLGKKLLLTGGGRCNITNLTPIKKMLNKFKNKDKKFLKHAFYTLDNKALLKIFEEKGLEFKEEENGRCFPINDDANSILNILKEYLNELNVDILLNNPVKSIEKNKDNTFKINTIIKDKAILSEKVILATGGIAYPTTGSTGDGYKIATDFNQELSEINPGAIPLKVDNKQFKELSGITLENVKVSYKPSKETINNRNISKGDISKENISKKQDKIETTQGNVLITHFGLSGPAILDISNFISKDFLQKDKNINKEDSQFDNISISIDLIPDLSKDELNNKIIADSPTHGTTMIKNYMKYYLKNRFISYFLNTIDVSGNKTLSNMSKKDKMKIITNLKQFNIKIDGLQTKAAMITCGGVEIDEINPKTMESELANGKELYFAGELLEPYGPTGGYNLQIAFSTGYLAGKSAAESLRTFQ